MDRPSPQQHRTLVAVAEAILPAGRFLPAAGEATVAKVERFASTLPGPLQAGLAGLLRGVDALAWLDGRRSFARLAPARRLAILDRWRTGDPVRRLLLRALASPLKIAHFGDPALYRRLGCVYGVERIAAEARPPYLRDRVHAALDADLAIECDVVVIGTGAGGAVVGRELAEAGLAVVFVEEGRYFERADFTGRAFEMQHKLCRRGGATFAIGNVPIPIPIGQTVGGSTTINSGTCSYDRVSGFGFMIEDTSRGAVREVMGQPVIRYSLTAQDVAHIKRAIDVLAQIYFAAGARRVHLPVAGFEVIESPAGLAALRRATIRPWDLDLSAYHPLGTARMGIDPASSVIGPDHQVHDAPGLYVVDGSAVPTPLGVNPQVTIMALATRAAERIAGALG